MSATPIIDGWFTTDDEPALLGTRCVSCGTVYFPRQEIFCKNPSCSGEEFEEYAFSRTGKVWSYTDFQYQPPEPFVAPTDPYEPFALAAVELPEGIVVLGQLAAGYGVADVKVGSPVEVVVETLNTDETGERSIWRWKPVAEGENR